MTAQTAISNDELRSMILRLARRKEGIGIQDLMLIGIGSTRATNHINKLTGEAKLIRAKGGWTGKHVRYFVSQLHANDFERQPRHAVPHMPQREIDRRVESGNVRRGVTVGIASGVDQRYQCTPQEADRLKMTGYFSTGQYRKDAR